MSFVSNDFLFIHIPKTGGTSAFSWLSNNFNIQEHSHERLENLYDLHKDKFKFSIIRNPYQRALSFYKNSLRMYKDPWFNQFIDNQGVNAVESGFEDFLDYIYYNNIIIYNKGENIPIDFKSSQFSYITVNNKIAVDKIIRLENIHKDWKEIQKRFNIFNDFPHLNKGVDIDYKFSNKSKKIIQEIYKEDFDNFNYDK